MLKAWEDMMPMGKTSPCSTVSGHSTTSTSYEELVSKLQRSRVSAHSGAPLELHYSSLSTREGTELCYAGLPGGHPILLYESALG